MSTLIEVSIEAEMVRLKAVVRSTAIMEAASFVLKHPEMDKLQLAEALLQLSVAPKGEA